MPSFRAHSVRFYAPQPKDINCLAHCCVSDHLAVSRSDGSVELWSVAHAPFMQSLIPPTIDASVESLCWAGSRLFSCGLHGLLLEYDLKRLCVKNTYSVTSGPAWCLAVHQNRSLIAVGTEEGFVSIFSVLSDSLEFLKVLDKQEGRILCLAWHPGGESLATGSIDTIRLWNTNTGHPTARMTTGRTEKNKETIVWSLAVTDDMTIISGDSRGKTSFWNGKNGTLMDSIQSHKADVLTVALNGNGTVAYSSGVDPTVMHFQIISKPDGRRKWVKSLHRVLSSHDVRALVSVKDKLYCGGVDTYLTISNYHYRTVCRVPHIPPGSVSSVGQQAGVLLLKYNTSLELWRLGVTGHKSGMIGSVLPLQSEPCKLIQVHSKDQEYIVSSAVSSSASWLAFATPTALRVYRCDITSPHAPTLSRIKTSVSQPLHHVAFFTGRLDKTSPTEEDFLLAVTAEGGLQIFALDIGTLSLVNSLLPAELQLSGVGPVSHVSISGGMALLAESQGGSVVAVDLMQGRVVAKLPAYREAPIAALALSPDAKTALLVYSNQRVAEVVVQTGRYTQFSHSFSQRVPPEWTARRAPIRGITYVQPDSEMILLYDDEYMAVIDKDKELPEPNAKLFISDPRWTPDDSQDGSIFSLTSPPSCYKPEPNSNTALRLLRKYSHLVGLHHLADDLIVCVEVRPGQIEELLPPSLKIKKYGAT